MIKFHEVMPIIGKLGGTIKFFPSDPDARLGIAEEISEMADNADQVRWLVKRIPKLFSEWPALREVRAVFCSKFKPKDGIEVYSQVYLEGIPSEAESAGYQIAAAPVLQLSGDTQAPSDDPDLAALVQRVSAAKPVRLPHVSVDTSLRAGETEYAALQRSISEFEETRKPEPRAATQSEIDHIKKIQAANRKETELIQ